MNLLSLLMVAIVASTIASASASVSDQDKDTLENMHRYGYIKGTGDGSNDSFTFLHAILSPVSSIVILTQKKVHGLFGQLHQPNL